MTPAELAAVIRNRVGGGGRHDGVSGGEIAATAPGRFILAVAGAPGAGKSTLAAALVADLGSGARLVPMDGFHLDNAVLDARGLRARKGAPETFDAPGFLALMARLRAGDGAEIAIPVFDRAADLSRAGADVVTPVDRILVVEGNYLLLDQAPWDGLEGVFDLTVFLDVPEAELERRLVQRWIDHGLDADAARARALSNDIPNARRVVAKSRPADIVIAQP